MYCKKCKVDLDYVGEVSAPGKGKFYECPECGENYWVFGSRVLRACDTMPEDINLDPIDII